MREEDVYPKCRRLECGCYIEDWGDIVSELESKYDVKHLDLVRRDEVEDMVRKLLEDAEKWKKAHDEILKQAEATAKRRGFLEQRIEQIRQCFFELPMSYQQIRDAKDAQWEFYDLGTKKQCIEWLQKMKELAVLEKLEGLANSTKEQLEKEGEHQK